MSLLHSALGGTLYSQRGLRQSTDQLRKSFERLSSGQRINHASDDPAALAISKKLKTDSLIYNRGRQNVNDGISLLNQADQALGELTGIVSRIQELAEQSANGIYTRTQRESADAEAQELAEEFTRIALSTEFNGTTLFDKEFGDLVIQAGYGTDAQISSDLGGKVSDETYQSASVATQSVYWTESADFNGDGNVDIVTVEDDTGFGVFRFYQGAGNGTFSAGQTMTIGDNPRYAEIADVNNDGNMDLLTPNYADGNVSIVLGNGDGTFQAASSVAVDTIAEGIEVNDFDGDGNQDMAVTTFSGNRVAIFMGNGDGTFGAQTSYTVGSSTYDLRSSDFNNDGVLDLAVSGTGGADTVTILNGTGDGSFSVGISYTMGDQPFYFDVGDLNNDGIEDLAAAAFADDELSVRFGNSDGTFQSITTISTGGSTSPVDVKIQDMNSDGNQDIVVSLFASGEVGIVYGNGDGTFEAIQSVTADTQTNGVEINDFNNDGVQDIVTANTGGDITINIANTTAGLSHLLPFDLTTQAGAIQALPHLERKIDSLSLHRGSVGAMMSRLESANTSLSDLHTNVEEAHSQITDVNVAEETAKLVQAQILQSAATAMQAQANLQSELVLELLS